jgi:hypothetical protein
MTEQDAQVLLKTALETSQMLHILAADLTDRLDDTEAKAARLNIGYVLAEIGERLLDPVFAAHPQYKPDDTGDAWRELSRKVGARDMR